MEHDRDKKQLGEDLLKKLTHKAPAYVRAEQMADKVGPFDVNVLLLGPSGSGKEDFASRIHEASGRRGEFVVVNCSLFTPDRLESELFGHVKGAYTGANSETNGKVQAADGGTLFLDAVGDCPLPVQAQLLRLLQTQHGGRRTQRVFSKMGSTEEKTADVRIVAATNKPIREKVAKGDFREDLFHRLARVEIRVPGLDECREDIPGLAQHFLARANRDYTNIPGYGGQKSLAEDAIRHLCGRIWPGSMRELNSAVTRTAIFAAGPELHEQDFLEWAPPSSAVSETESIPLPSEEDFSLDAVTAQLQRRYIQVAREISGGNDALVARLLGFKSRQALAARCKALEMKRKTEG